MQARRSLIRDSSVLWVVVVVMLLAASPGAFAQTSAFTYQGRLTDAGSPANGNYDLQFALWDSANGGSQIGATQVLPAVQVSGGIFTVTLDFGANAFPGATRFLEISARMTGAGAFTLLTPRQQITSTPYAVRSGNATVADNATQLGGVSANQYVQTNDLRLSDSRSPTPNSSNYIQNTTNQQSTSNFNISGNGTVGGTLSATSVNANGPYNLGGSRILSTANLNDLFVGFHAGQANTTGAGNSFFGYSAGESNSSASQNSFFGYQAGQKNTTGGNNSFFGIDAGSSNSTADRNSFFGAFAGLSNTSGDRNSFFGQAAGFLNTTGTNNAFFGDNAGNSNNLGAGNSFFGSSAGQSNSASGNSFVGFEAGMNNTTASNNAFFGMWAGLTNTTGGDNSFFGRSAGFGNTTGTGNSFFGGAAGLNNSTGFQNNFLGINAGFSNTTGTNNTIIGTGADVGGSNLDNATALGSFARVDCGNCLVLGSIKGTNNAPADSKVGLGTTTPVSKLDVLGTNATCGAARLGWGGSIGFGCFGVLALTSDDAAISFVQANNPSGTVFSISGNGDLSTLGNVGVGTFLPAAKLHVSGGAILLDNNQGLYVKSNSIFGQQKRVLLADTSNTLHIGSGGGLGFDQIRFDLGTPGTVMTMLSSGNIGIGTTAPDQLLSVNGNASKVGGGSWQVFSDERLKNIRGQFTAGLQTLRQLQPVRYQYKRNNPLGLRSEGEYIGFSAQAVAKVLPEAVTKTTSGYLQINNDPILWTMLNAIKEQQAQIEKQQEEIKHQEEHDRQQRAEFAAQQQEIKALKNLLCRSHQRASVCK